MATVLKYFASKSREEVRAGRSDQPTPKGGNVPQPLVYMDEVEGRLVVTYYVLDEVERY